MPPSDPTVADSPPPARLQRRDLRRLPGRPSLLTPVSFYRLWLADDFLLQLQRTGYTQRLQRFAYRDIQALEICRTPRGWVYNVILGSLTLLCLLLAWPADRNFLVAAGCLLALLIVNVVRGPTCACVLQTALGPRALPSLSRERTARRAVARIAERAEAAQGGRTRGDETRASPAALTQQNDQLRRGPAGRAEFQHGDTEKRRPEEKKAEGGRRKAEG